MKNPNTTISLQKRIVPRNEALEKRRPQWLSGPALYCIVPMLLALLSFYSVWKNSFTNWDDNVYVIENSIIRSLSWQNILHIFSPATFVVSNYQPLTILSYAFNYAGGKLDPAGYIALDLFIHLLNVLLAFILIRRISKSNLTASICALLFGIHPMHVESVAWVAARKDLLYTFFYLASALLYLSYLEKKHTSAAVHYSIACILFVCSLLSKATAVTLPAALLLMDYYQKRKFSTRMLLDKLPFILPSLILGLWAFKGQHDTGALAANGILPVFSKISIACYSFMFYVIKFFLPFKLSSYYLYPDSLLGTLPLQYLLSPVFALAAGGLVWYFRKSKAVVFGFLFFFANILPNLHFIPVGATVTADRYTYLAYLGLSFPVVYYCGKAIFSLRLKNMRIAIATTAIVFLAIAFGYAVHQRAGVWKNSVTLWTDVIGKYPSLPAYRSRASAYYMDHDYARAIEDYNKVISLYPYYADPSSDHGHLYATLGGDSRQAEDYIQALKNIPGYAEAFNDRGKTFDGLGEYAQAVEDYTQAIAHKPGYAEAYSNRGSDYCKIGNDTAAVDDLNKAISLEPGYAVAYSNLGNIFFSKGAYADAISCFSQALAANPNLAEAWYNQGCACQALHDLDKALTCFTRALQIDPALILAYGNRGVTYGMKSDFDHAIADFNRVISLQPSPDAYFNRGYAYAAKGDYTDAISDYSRTLSLDSSGYPKAFYNRGLAYESTGDMERAREDFRSACSMHMSEACAKLENDKSNRPYTGR